jgi:transposase
LTKIKATLARELNWSVSQRSGVNSFHSNGKGFRRSKLPGTRVISQEQLTAEQRQHVQQFCQASPDLALAYALSQDFISLLTQQKAEELSDWFRRAKQSQVAELMSLAKSMQQDSSAIAAACSLPWSQRASRRAGESSQMCEKANVWESSI